MTYRGHVTYDVAVRIYTVRESTSHVTYNTYDVHDVDVTYVHHT